MSLLRASIALGLLGLASCSGPSLTPSLPKPPKETKSIEQAHLLLFPIAEAEALLGRSVHTSEDGAWTIADTRSPGCEVEVRRKDAVYSSRREVELDSRTTLSAGYAKLIGFQARFGSANRADIDITNSAILEADIRGSCGDVIVDKIFVGRGKRSLLARAGAEGSLDLAFGPLTPGGSVERGSRLLDTTAWETDQAYGFTFKKIERAEPLHLEVTLPDRVTEGDKVELRFETSRPAWLVVYYLDETGEGQVLWPSSEERAPFAEPGKPAVLPSPSEREAGVAIQATLLTPGKPTRETLVVYAFAERGDFERLKPEVGGAQPDGAAYAAELSRALSDVPISRWSRKIVGYEIRPRVVR